MTKTRYVVYLPKDVEVEFKRFTDTTGLGVSTAIAMLVKIGLKHCSGLLEALDPTETKP